MLEDLCGQQCGIASRAQILACGLSDKLIESRLRAGRWQRLHAGVFAAFSGEVPRLGTLWGAVLRAGAGAVLSHESAAEVAGLIDRPDTQAVIHITVPTSRRVQHIPGVVVHRSVRAEEARHPTRLPPQTRIEETIVDLTQTAHSLEQAVGWIARAIGGRLTTTGRLNACMAQRLKLRWRADLAHALHDVATGCHSLLELRYLRKVERPHGLPVGDRQAPARRGLRKIYHDVLYRRYRTIVELDGRAAHPDADRSRDRRRDNASVANGHRVLRYETADVNTTPCETAQEIATVLRQNGWPGFPRGCSPTCVIAEDRPPQRGEDPPPRQRARSSATAWPLARAAP